MAGCFAILRLFNGSADTACKNPLHRSKIRHFSVSDGTTRTVTCFMPWVCWWYFDFRVYDSEVAIFLEAKILGFQGLICFFRASIWLCNARFFWIFLKLKTTLFLNNFLVTWCAKNISLRVIKVWNIVFDEEGVRFLRFFLFFLIFLFFFSWIFLSNFQWHLCQGFSVFLR